MIPTSPNYSSSALHKGPHQGLHRFATLHRQSGQALVFSLFAAMLILLSMFAMYNMNTQAIEKMKLQNTADSAAYSAVVAEARDYNFSAYTNRAMVANQVAVAQFVGLTSWFRNMSAFAAPNSTNGGSSNAGRTVYQLFFDIFSSPLGNIYMKFLKGFGKAMGIFDEGNLGSSFMSAVVTVLDGLILVYGETQRIFHYGTALTIAETLGAFSTIGKAMADLTGADWFTGMEVLDGGGNIISANDKNAQLSTVAGLTYLIYHLYKWYGFTERKDPNTAGADGAEADRFAQVTMDSLDDFSRDRSTKPAWGVSMFYAPPLTFIDPTRFIPYQNGPLFMPVIHRGGTELKLTDTNGAGGTGPNTNPDGNTGVDCHGNAVSANTSTSGSGSGSIKVGHPSDLSAYSASACPGDTASVTDNADPETLPPGPNAGVYSFDGTTWNHTAPYSSNGTGTNPQNKQGNASGKSTPTSSTAGRGATGSKNKKSWTAMDASSWMGIDIIWFTIPVIFVPIPLPIPFAPPWMPLSHGGAQSGAQLAKPTVLATDNNFGVSKDDAYGSVASSWTTKTPASMRQNKGAGTTLDKLGLGGLTQYMDVKDITADNLTGPPLVVEVEKNVENMSQNTSTGPFALESGAPKKKLDGKGVMRALSKAQVYFSRPTSDAALDWFKRASASPNQVELGSLYNPYWQARLMPNQFLEQYLSMELQRAGL